MSSSLESSKFNLSILSRGQVVTMITFYSNDPSSNLAEAKSFSVSIFEKNENRQKEAGVGH